MDKIPECFYRISVKALILNESRDKFLIVQEEDGRWELPGGGLEYEETPQNCIQREIIEEMGLEVTEVADKPAYFLTFKNDKGSPRANIFFETKLKNLAFTPSDECINIRFVNEEDADWLNEQQVYPNVLNLLKMFNHSNN